MELLRIKLDLPISVNALYRSRSDGRRYMTEQAKNWQGYAVYSIRDTRTLKDNVAIQEARVNKEPLVLNLDIQIPAKRILSRDSDNMVKLMQDTVIMALWPSDPEYEDCYVFDVHVKKRPSATGDAFVLVTLETLDDEELRHAIQPTAPRRTPPTRRRAAHRALAQSGTRTAQKRTRGSRTNAPDEDTHRAS